MGQGRQGSAPIPRSARCPLALSVIDINQGELTRFAGAQGNQAGKECHRGGKGGRTNPAGEIIEDRLSQVTYSALGQQASSADKYAWAEANVDKRKQLNEAVKALLPEFEVRTAGTTSLDITKPGVDKAYGMKRLLEATGCTKEDILFFGDKLEEGGNDFPVRNMGIDCIAVERWEDTAYAVEGIVAVSK